MSQRFGNGKYFTEGRDIQHLNEKDGMKKSKTKWKTCGKPNRKDGTD